MDNRCYKVTVAVRGVEEARNSALVNDLVAEFEHRTWHRDVAVWWEVGELRLSAWNDYDNSGEALMDELMDAVVAYADIESDVSVFLIAVES